MAVEVIRATAIEVAYERVGEGPPLLLVHAAAANGRMGKPQLSVLVMARRLPPRGLRGLPRSLDRGARPRAGARRGPLLGRHGRTRHGEWQHGEIDASEDRSSRADVATPPAEPSDRSVRRATPDDALEVARLLHDFNTEFGDPTPGVDVLTVRIRELLAAGEITVLLGGRGPDGLALTRLRPSLWSESLDAYLEELYVVADQRGRGLGRALLDSAMEDARRAGAAHIELGTSVDDTAAIALYESAGFTNREREPDGPSMLFYERDL